MSQMAFVSPDGRIYLTDLSSSDSSPLTTSDYICSWPTWSRDGKGLAYSAMRTSLDGYNLLGVFTRKVDDITPRFVYMNDPGTGNIAVSTPHYLHWSNDGTMLGIIAQTPQAGLSLFVHDVSDSKQPDPVINGGPLYFSWSYDSRFLLVHSFQSHYMIDFGKERDLRQVPGTSSLYMAPSWSPVSHEIAMCRDIGNNLQTLMVGNFVDARVRAVAQVEGGTSFSWSPNRNSLAFMKDLHRRTGYYSGLWLSVEGASEPVQISDDHILSFFWSPDGNKIAYITPSDGADGSVRWAVIDVQSREITYLSDFRPTHEQLITFMFFDQYGQSHSPWSADGNWLVFCGELGYHLVRTELPTSERSSVYVIDVSGNSTPIEKAKGTFAVWSPAND